ncbi:hypothetical protein PVK06_039857 [Gossypium arboreum]|uniref:Uncharacterized protein n=1 Tax=Gossypium arboreum TaxID=29729 RepID=A0ABR0N3Y9_GOSAR|nr:hypothetical protein PVK06_039857 [Gossypium arboreum]
MWISMSLIKDDTEKLKNEKIQLGIDINVQKLEAKKIRKGKNKAEDDLNSLKMGNKKLHLSIKTVGLGKTSRQWQQEIQEEKNKADQWDRKFQDALVQEDSIKGELLESQVEKAGWKAQVAELEKSLYQHRSCNSVTELKASQAKNKELKRKVEELGAALQNCELRIELPKENRETNNEYWKEQLQRSQGQVRDKDHVMSEALAQVREVARHLQTLPIQVDILSLKYELESDQGLISLAS